MKIILYIIFVFNIIFIHAQNIIRDEIKIKSLLNNELISESLKYDSIYITRIPKVKLNSIFSFKTDSVNRNELYYSFNGIPLYLQWYSNDTLKLFNKNELIKLLKLASRKSSIIDFKKVQSELIDRKYGISKIDFQSTYKGFYNDKWFKIKKVPFEFSYVLTSSSGNRYPVPSLSNLFVTFDELNLKEINNYGLFLTFYSLPSDYPKNIEINRYIFFDTKFKIASCQLLSPFG